MPSAKMQSNDDAEPESGYRDFPESIAGWQLTPSSKRADGPGANYQDPHRERVFVNIGHINPVEGEKWRAKFNPHTVTNGCEQICVSEDRETVLQAAFEWMREHPAGSPDDDRQQARLTDAAGGSQGDSQ